MLMHLAADGVLLVHLAFILFVLLGGLLVWRWPRLAWLHLPAVAWGALIEYFGWICPLTPLENYFRQAAGAQGYSGGFIEHYLLPVVYPEGLARSGQLALGLLVLFVNALVYTRLLIRREHPPA